MSAKDIVLKPISDAKVAKKLKRLYLKPRKKKKH